MENRRRRLLPSSPPPPPPPFSVGQVQDSLPEPQKRSKSKVALDAHLEGPLPFLTVAKAPPGQESYLEVSHEEEEEEEDRPRRSFPPFPCQWVSDKLFFLYRWSKEFSPSGGGGAAGFSAALRFLSSWRIRWVQVRIRVEKAGWERASTSSTVRSRMGYLCRRTGLV